MDGRMGIGRGERMNVPKGELIDGSTEGWLRWHVILWPLPNKLYAVCFDAKHTTQVGVEVQIPAFLISALNTEE